MASSLGAPDGSEFGIESAITSDGGSAAGNSPGRVVLLNRWDTRLLATAVVP
jgi:hypothetical protein